MRKRKVRVQIGALFGEHLRALEAIETYWDASLSLGTFDYFTRNLAGLRERKGKTFLHSPVRL